MKLRFGLVATSALTLVLGACASSGGGSAPATQAAVPVEGETLAMGESERQNDFTREAERNLEDAEDAATPQEAQGYYQAALNAAQLAIQSDSTNPLPYYQGGQAALMLEDYELAGDLLDRAEELRPIYSIEIEPMRERAWVERYQQGAPLLNQGDYTGAIAYFEQADAIYEGRPAVKYTLAQLYAQEQRWDESIAMYQGALDIIQSDAIDEQTEDLAAQWRAWGESIPTEMAQTLVNSGDDAQAVEVLTQLLADNPTDVRLLRLRGTAYANLEQPAEAQQDFEAIMALEGLNSSDYYAAGVGLYRLEQFELAADAFQMAVGASPNDRDALEFWARSLQLAYPAGDNQPEAPEGALEEMQGAGERWLELDPYNPNAFIILAQTVNRLGDGVRAGELVTAIEELPLNVENLRLQRYGNGGAFLTGGIRNKTLDAGTTVTMEVTFYDAAGQVLETQTARVQVGEADMVEAIRIDATTEDYVGGIGYEIIM